ncbi:MAG: ribosome maturation factor RimM [Clostridiales bacterium]|nr:ribosome maturation factor RimM [Clostridiales bacterium]HBM81657.1 16S rRNA processing protein RimM [Clostridiaceae bacterium]
MEVKYLRIGKIINTHGIKGELKVLPLTDNIKRFSDLSYVLLDDEKLYRYEVEYVNYFKGTVLLKLKGIDNVDDALKIKGYYILIERKDAIKLPEGSYFICDIIGLDVQDINKGYMGKISDVISTGSNDVYVIKQYKTNKEILIPALKSVVKDIDIKSGKMVIDMPEGIL